MTDIEKINKLYEDIRNAYLEYEKARDSFFSDFPSWSSSHRDILMSFFADEEDIDYFLQKVCEKGNCSYTLPNNEEFSFCVNFTSLEPVTLSNHKKGGFRFPLTFIEATPNRFLKIKGIREKWLSFLQCVNIDDKSSQISQLIFLLKKLKHKELDKLTKEELVFALAYVRDGYNFKDFSSFLKRACEVKNKNPANLITDFHSIDTYTALLLNLETRNSSKMALALAVIGIIFTITTTVNLPRLMFKIKRTLSYGLIRHHHPTEQWNYEVELFFKKNPGLINFKSSVEKSRPLIGMTEELVLLALGVPLESITTVSFDGEFKRMTYANIEVYTKNGILEKWETIPYHPYW